MKNKVTLEGDVRNNQLETKAHENMMRCIRNLNGKRARIIVEECKRSGSNRQKSYYFTVIVSLVHEWMLDQGNTMDTEEVHNFLKVDVGHLIREINIKGARRKVVRSLADCSTDELEEYFEKCRAWGAVMGVQIPLPWEGIRYG